MNEFELKKRGAKWYHTDDYHSPNISKASLGLFFHTVLSEGAHIGTVWPFNERYNRTPVIVTVLMTEEMKHNIEVKTKFKFRDPPKIVLN